ncbi:MAG TPA: hypothetical protein VGG71_08540 [Chitinophagaceae bacterium]
MPPPPPGGPVDDGLDTLQLAGDQLIIVSTLAGGDSGLAIVAQSVKLYDCSPYLTAYGMGLNGTSPLSTISFEFNSAEVIVNTGNCTGGKKPAQSLNTIIPPTNGFYTVTASLNQVNYSGSLTVTSTEYTFTWNYTSGVTISPLQIKKK